jgi:protoporphyrinogen oxidase
MAWLIFSSVGSVAALLTWKILSYAGVYAGDPSKLSMKAAFGKVWKLEQNGGSIIGGTFKTIQERNKVPKPPQDP